MFAATSPPPRPRVKDGNRRHRVQGGSERLRRGLGQRNDHMAILLGGLFCMVFREQAGSGIHGAWRTGEEVSGCRRS